MRHIKRKEECKVWYRSERAEKAEEESDNGLNVFTSAKYALKEKPSEAVSFRETTKKIFLDFSRINIFKGEFEAPQKAKPSKKETQGNDLTDKKDSSEKPPEPEKKEPILQKAKTEISNAIEDFIESQKKAQEGEEDFKNLFDLGSQTLQLPALRKGKKPRLTSSAIKILLWLLILSNIALFWQQSSIMKNSNEQFADINSRLDDLQSSVYRQGADIGDLFNRMKRMQAKAGSNSKEAKMLSSEAMTNSNFAYSDDQSASLNSDPSKDDRAVLSNAELLNVKEPELDTPDELEASKRAINNTSRKLSSL